MINRKHKDGCAFHIVKGNHSVKDIIDYVRHSYKEWLDLNGLWDFTDNSFSHNIPSYYSLKSSLCEIQDVVVRRAGKKTAFVVSDDGTFATIRMAIAAGEYIEKDGTFSTVKMPVTADECIFNDSNMCVFRKFEEALAWLS